MSTIITINNMYYKGSATKAVIQFCKRPLSPFTLSNTISGNEISFDILIEEIICYMVVCNMSADLIKIMKSQSI